MEFFYKDVFITILLNANDFLREKFLYTYRMKLYSNFFFTQITDKMILENKKSERIKASLI